MSAYQEMDNWVVLQSLERWQHQYPIVNPIQTQLDNKRHKIVIKRLLMKDCAVCVTCWPSRMPTREHVKSTYSLTPTAEAHTLSINKYLTICSTTIIIYV